LLGDELIAELRYRGKGKNEAWVGLPKQIKEFKQSQFPNLSD